MGQGNDPEADEAATEDDVDDCVSNDVDDVPSCTCC
jgi:hypothetical protein